MKNPVKYYPANYQN